MLFFVVGKGFFASLGVAGFFLGVAGFFFSDVNFLVCGFGFFGAVTEPALLFEPPPSPFFAALLGVVCAQLGLKGLDMAAEFFGGFVDIFMNEPLKGGAVCQTFCFNHRCNASSSIF